MPVNSEAQRRLMEAAAHTEGGAGGVPQSVGQEMVAETPSKPLPDRMKPNANDRRKKLYPSMKE